MHDDSWGTCPRTGRVIRYALLAVLATGCGGPAADGGGGAGDPSLTPTATSSTPPTPTVPTDGDDCLTDEEQFARDVSPTLQEDCVACHQAGSVAGDTRHVLVPSTDPDHLAHNRAVLEPLALETAGDLSLLVAKALGEEDHGGGPRLSLSDPRTDALMAFVGRVHAPGGCEDPTDEPLDLEVPATPMRRLTPSQLQNTLADLFPGIAIEPVGVQPDPLVHGFDNNATAQGATALQVSQVHAASLAATTAAMAEPELWLSCDLATADEACLHGFVEDFVARAFRRPLTADEATAFTGFYDEMLAEEGDAAAALQLTLQAALNSPSFLYLVEFGTDDLAAPGERVPLSGHEVASRLSYFLWNTMPDDALLAAADAGELATAPGVEAQAWRMLEDPRATQAVANFHRLWLELDEVAHIDPNADAFPDWDEAVPALARTELDDLVHHSAFGPDPTLSTLLLSRRTVATDGLAALYGVGAPPASGVQELPAAERAGFLTRAGWLGATSHEVYASPIQRGVFVLERLMCVPPPAPPADIDTSLDSDPGAEAVTNRERHEQHSSDPACFGCHEGIDGIGFGFENYDATGTFRTLDHGQAVDATGTFVDGDLSGTDYEGALEMSELLAGSETVHRCAVTQWYRYALGRTEQLGDQPTLDELVDAYWGTGGELPQLLVDLTLTESFRTRRAE